ncbi:MAG: HEPN domain-containing protein [Thermoproteota archaeon]
MNTRSMALEYLERSKRYIAEAGRAVGEADYPTTVRRCQESVEMAVKAILRLLGIEYPRKHDVSDVLQDLKNMGEIPKFFKDEIPFISSTISRLTSVRGLAMYGDESSLTPPARLFSSEDAEKALNDAKRVLELCLALFKKWS